MALSDVYNSVKEFVGPAHYIAPKEEEKPAKPVIDRQKFLNAIAQNETSIVPGDKYKSSQPSGVAAFGSAMGKYRVTEAELKAYGKRYLGQSMTPQQFMASTTAQDNYMYNKAAALAAQGYTPEDIADIHNKGIKKSNPPGSGKYQNPDYVQKFISNYYKK